jgi:uncharacterized protein VirK/YbjX
MMGIIDDPNIVRTQCLYCLKKLSLEERVRHLIYHPNCLEKMAASREKLLAHEQALAKANSKVGY